MNNNLKLTSPRGESFPNGIKSNGKVEGFTVLEMLVVIGVAAIITSTVLGNYPEFLRRLAIEREAQLLALGLREAEEHAIRTKRAGSGFVAPFGVHFDLAKPKEYILFADFGTPNNFYDVGEEIEIIQIGRGVQLRDLCADEKQGTPDCNINSLSITFERPAPLIKVRGIKGGPVEDLGEPDFEIYVETEDGVHTQEIVVWTTGAISIEN